MTVLTAFLPLGTNSINYYAPQIFQSIGLKGQSAGLFATGVYGIVKIVCTALGLMFATEQIGRKVRHPSPSYRRQPRLWRARLSLYKPASIAPRTVRYAY